MKTSKRFNEVLMTANGGHEEKADEVFTETLGQYVGGFSEEELDLASNCSKERIFFKFQEMEVLDAESDFRLTAVAIGGSWFRLPDNVAIYLYVDLDPVREDFVYLGHTVDGELYEMIGEPGEPELELESA